jgi:hypothetical protein
MYMPLLLFLFSLLVIGCCRGVRVRVYLSVSSCSGSCPPPPPHTHKLHASYRTHIFLCVTAITTINPHAGYLDAHDADQRGCHVQLLPVLTMRIIRHARLPLRLRLRTCAESDALAPGSHGLTKDQISPCSSECSSHRFVGWHRDST